MCRGATRRDGARVADDGVEIGGSDSLCVVAARRDGARVADDGVETVGTDSVCVVAARRDASVVGDSGTICRGRDLADALRNCWRAETADEGDRREQQDKAGQ